MDSQSDLIKPRLEKREKLFDAGIDPYGGRFDVSESIATARANQVRTAKCGWRGGVQPSRHGQEPVRRHQGFHRENPIYIQKQSVGEEQFESFKHFIDLGDIIGITGKLFTTRAGELTVKIEGVTLLSKAIQPLPKEWYGIKDIETRLRQRYLDLILNDTCGKSLWRGAVSCRRSASFSMRAASWKWRRR